MPSSVTAQEVIPPKVEVQLKWNLRGLDFDFYQPTKLHLTLQIGELDRSIPASGIMFNGTSGGKSPLHGACVIYYTDQVSCYLNWRERLLEVTFRVSENLDANIVLTHTDTWAAQRGHISPQQEGTGELLSYDLKIQ